MSLLCILRLLILGSMTDYNYVYGNCLEITVELSCCKYPPSAELSRFWTINRDPLLAFAAQVNMITITRLYK